MEYKNPFRVLVPEHIPPEEWSKIRVERTPQYSELLSCIANTSGNIAITGPRGSGKTFLLHDVLSNIDQESQDVIFVRGIFGAPEYSELISEFLVQYCHHVWEQVFKSEISELIRLSLRDFSSLIDDFKPKKKKFATIYQTIVSQRLAAKTSRISSIGTPKIIKTELKDTHTTEFNRGALSTVEYIALLKELNALNNHKPFIFVWDDLNHLPNEMQQAMMNDFFKNSRFESLRFLAVFSQIGAEEFSWSQQVDGFDSQVRLAGFSSSGDLHAMLKKYAEGSRYILTRSVSDILFEHTGGIPRLALDQLSAAVDRNPSRYRISVGSITQICLEYQIKLAEELRYLGEIQDRDNH